MNQIRKISKTLIQAASLPAFLFLLSSSLNAQNLEMSEGKLWLEGNSTLHAYASTATQIDLSGIWNPETAPLKPGGLKELKLRIPVKGLKSGKKGLDKNMYETLKAADHPEIVFQLVNYEISQSSALTLVKAEGVLTVAGNEKPVQLDIETAEEKGGIRIRGSEDLLMSDFGIKPPAMMLGTLKTHDKVTIRFDLLLNGNSGRQANDAAKKEMQ